MGLLGNLFGSSNSNKKSGSRADELATSFVSAFRDKASIEELNRMSEDLVELARIYWGKGDYDSYKKLLSAAEETSYMYQGSKYPNDLVEELIRNSH